MANQQLLDYVKQQLQLGVPKESVKSALLESGWPVADVDEALGGSSPAAAVAAAPAATAAAPAAAATPAAATASVSPAAVKPVGGISFGASTAPGKTVKDLFQTSNESVFKPAAAAAAGSVAKGFDDMSHPHHPHYWLLPAILGVVVVTLLGGMWWLYAQTGAVRAELQAATDSSAALSQQLAAKGSEGDGLRAEVQKLTGANRNLSNLVLLYSVSTSSQALEITVSGILGGSDKAGYTLTTLEQTLIGVKNSKDVAVVATLQPLVGSNVTLAGNFLPGGKAMTVTQVNGAAPVVPAPAAATSTGASSTAP